MIKKNKLYLENLGKVESVLLAVSKELRNCNAWEVTHVVSKKKILKGFKEKGIPEECYEPWMANNVLPTISLK